MHETSEEISALQDLLDRSYADAGVHLRSIHTDNWRMTAEAVCATLSGVCVLNLATVSRRGRPIVAPVDGLFLGGLFWFGSAHNSLRFRHIRHTPFVSGAYTRGEEVSVVVHGVAKEIDTASGEYERLHEYCREIYGTGYDGWGFWGKQPYAWIEPERMYAIEITHAETGKEPGANTS